MCPVYYVSHHEVLKPESPSTPCRIIFNSSAKFQGQILKNYWAKVPGLLNNMLGVLLKFLKFPVLIVHFQKFQRMLENVRGNDQYFLILLILFGLKSRSWPTQLASSQN